MKKKLSILIILSILILATSAVALQNVGPSRFTWIPGGFGEFQGQKTYDYWYSDCVTFTDDPNIIVFCIKFVYTPYGRGRHNVFPGSAYSIGSYNYNRVTGMAALYSIRDFNANDVMINRTTISEDFKYPNPNSVLESVVSIIRNQYQCTRY